MPKWFKQENIKRYHVHFQIPLTLSFECQLEKIKDIYHIKAITPPPPQSMIFGTSTSVVLFGQTDASNYSSWLGPSEGEKFFEIMKDHHLEQFVHFPTRENDYHISPWPVP